MLMQTWLQVCINTDIFTPVNVGLSVRYATNDSLSLQVCINIDRFTPVNADISVRYATNDSLSLHVL